jgi:hypothetical protein
VDRSLGRVGLRALAACLVGAFLAASPAAPAVAQVEAPPEPPPGQAAAEPSVPCSALGRQVVGHLRAEEWLDAHLLAQLAAGLCAGPDGERAAMHGAVALVQLEELERAVALLAGLRESGDLGLRATAAVLESWALLAADRAAFTSSLDRLPAPSRRRLEVLAALDEGDEVRRLSRGLEEELRRVVEERYGRLEQRRSKRPWLAGGLSAILPGAGQVYAGSWEAGAVALVLNGVLIAATVELAREELYFAASTTGLAASVFYVGGILNAADLARRYNDRASAADRRALDRALVPEAFP